MNVIFDYFKELNSNNNDLEISQTSRINSDTRNSDTIDNVHILVNDETIASSSALNDFITEAEINSTIKTLKSDKSCGCDEIVNEYITSTILCYQFILHFLILSWILEIYQATGQGVSYYQFTKTKEVNATLLTIDP